MRALIVHEVFDANDLDISIIEAAIRAGVAVTLVGDPWQALYVFRGARPDVVPHLLQRTGVRTLRLTQSFRWRSQAQEQLATDLRSGRGVPLPTLDAAQAALGIAWPSGPWRASRSAPIPAQVAHVAEAASQGRAVKPGTGHRLPVCWPPLTVTTTAPFTVTT
jgi:hypothetical protein